MSTKSKNKIKSRFEVDELVLCYEPDPTKAQVLYDSKILEVVEKKEKGKKCMEYRVHFQGWNSSWDRFVGEKYILKRNDDNLKLQEELRENAKKLKESLRLKKKKNQYTLTELIRASMDKSSTTANSRRGTEEVSIGESTSGDSLEGDVSEEEGPIKVDPIVLPDEAKRRLEDDYYSITEDQKLAQMPAKLTVVRILEDYVLHYAYTELARWAGVMKNLAAPPKQTTTASTPPTAIISTNSTLSASLPSTSQSTKGTSVLPGNAVVEEKIEADELYPVIQRIRLVKEVVEGVRVMFDFLINQILLYKEEMEQFKNVKNLKPTDSISKIQIASYFTEMDVTLINSIYDAPCEPESIINIEQEKDNGEPNTKKVKTGKKGVKKSSSTSETSRESTSTGSTESTALKIIDDALPPYYKRLAEFIKNLMEWKLIPDSNSPNRKRETSPSCVYGSVHLLRLFVKLPEILDQISMPRRKQRMVVRLLNQFIEYISRQDSFGPHLYCSVKQNSEVVSSDEDGVTSNKKGWKSRAYTK